MCASYEREDLTNASWNRRYNAMREKLATVEGCREVIEFYNDFEKTRNPSYGEMIIKAQAVERLCCSLSADPFSYLRTLWVVKGKGKRVRK